MRELSASAFPLGETSLHLLHTPDGDMFVTADLAVKLFDSAPATFAEFVRANRYVRVNSMERAVVRLCASLGIPPETAGGDKPVPVPATGTATNDDAKDAKDGKTSSNALDAVTMLPEKSVLAILVDRRASKRAAQFRETAARRSLVAAERLAKRGDFENALPLALDAVRRAQDIHETPRARMRAEAAHRGDAVDASDVATATSHAPSDLAVTPPTSNTKHTKERSGHTHVPTTSAPHVALFEPYLLASKIALALGKTDACENLAGLASWISLRRGEKFSEAQRARLRRLRGELRLKQGRKVDALEEFASAAVHAAEVSGPQTPRVALELFKLADAFREDAGSAETEEGGGRIVPHTSPDQDAGRDERDKDETRDAKQPSSLIETETHSPRVSADDHASCLRSASRCDLAATNVWLAAAADALGLLKGWSANETPAARAFATRARLSSFSPESRVSFLDLGFDALEEASTALGHIVARNEGSAHGNGDANDIAATASLARGLLLFAARERRVSVSEAAISGVGRSGNDVEDVVENDAEDGSESFSRTSTRLFAPTFEEAVKCVAEAMAAFPQTSNGAAFARAALERWSGGGDDA